MVPAHQKPPGIRSGQLNIIVPLQADRFNQNAKVQQSLVQPLRDILGVAAVQVIANVRVFPGQGPGGPGNQTHGVCLPAADGDLSADLLLGRLKGTQRLVCQGHNLLRLPVQTFARLCQGNPPVLPPPVKELCPQFLLQLHQLPGQSRLGDVKLFRSSGNALHAGHRQKIAQNP